MAALYASAEGDLGQLRRLLLSGVPVSLADYDGRTLLHLACSEGHMAIVKYLVKIHHADMLVMDRWGGTPLSDAEKGGHVKVVAWLNKVSRWRELQHQRVSNGSASVLNHELHMSSGGEEEK